MAVSEKAPWSPMSLEARMRVLEMVMNSPKTPAGARVTATLKYEELLAQLRSSEEQEDVGEELRAFLAQIRLEHGSLEQDTLDA